ncbi:MAG: fatty acid desaturase [Bdellovibrionaceae bacterium]|nr:fatty acid desaturase [Pseudobdellovibrionaceae bacterium]
MKQKLTLKNFNWVSAIFLVATPILAVILTYVYFTTETFNPWMIFVFLFFYFATGMSITGGYHRLIAHKAYTAHPLIEALYLFFGAGAFQNSAKKWVIDHRIHHRYVDQDLDPYTVKHGFWHAHFFWMFNSDSERETSLGKMYSRDLDKDKLIVFQDKHYLPIAILAGFVAPMLMGWAFGSWFGGLVLAGLLRMVIVHHFTFFINSLCHYWGWQPYTDTNTARDNMVLAIFTYGEGYHNFHHIFHADYRNGIRWYHIDPTKWFIKTLAYLNLVRNLRVTPDYEIFKARMIMFEKRLKEQKNLSMLNMEALLLNLKLKTEEAHQKMISLREEYERLKLQFHNDSRVRQLRRDLLMAKWEFQMSCRQWRLCLKMA